MQTPRHSTIIAVTAVVSAAALFTAISKSLHAGDQVTWTHRASMPHTVTGTHDGALSSGRLGSGTLFTHTFNEPGTYRYYCALHPSMTGTVIVE